MINFFNLVSFFKSLFFKLLLLFSFFNLTTVNNFDSFFGYTRLRSHSIEFVEMNKARSTNLTENGVILLAVIKPISAISPHDIELGAVVVMLTRIHGNGALLIVLVDSVIIIVNFVFEIFSTVNRLAALTISKSNVAGLGHKISYDAIEHAALVVKRFFGVHLFFFFLFFDKALLTGAECAEVFRANRSVSIEVDFNAIDFFICNRYV